MNDNETINLNVMSTSKTRKKMTKFEKLSIVFGVLGIIGMVLSFEFNRRSVMVGKEQLELGVKSTRSSVTLQIGRDKSQNKITFSEPDSYESGAIYRQRYTVLINNIGLVDASITSSRTLIIVPPTDSTKIMYGIFSDMKPKLSKDGIHPLELPITISPNHPQKLIFEIGVNVPVEAWNKVKNTLQKNKQYDYEEAERIFHDAGHPFLGQLDSTSNNGYGDTGNLQKYLLMVTKGDGKEISADVFHNVSEYYIQGESKPEITGLGGK